jgi:hypothetical protein
MTPEKGAREAALTARAAGVPLLLAAKKREWVECEYFAAEVAPLLGGDVQYVGEADHERKLELLRGARALLNPICWPEPYHATFVGRACPRRGGQHAARPA